ncbi:MAG: ATP-dependent helicase, partial [Gammaproteobacteria bacterium]|nr:ATP-dependent helicase [Gammaproteobacteria bacterium]
MEFTTAQQEAIDHVDGNLQLIACAGSGKTEVVARRVVTLLRPAEKSGGGCAPQNIVAFTFTDKAAAELKERIYDRCREEFGEMIGLAEMYIGTIHGFCLSLLQEEVPEYLKYEVLNEVQQALFVDRHSRASGLTQSETINGVKLKRYIDTRNYIGAHSILREDEIADPSKLVGNTVAENLPVYEALLHQKGYLDYSSILKEAAVQLENNAALRQRLAQRVRHIIVDEYQDVNPVQEEVVRILHELGASVCVVGDDDQTLYQWRGSDVQNILGFADRYPDVTPVRMEENFRSSEGIIAIAHQFVRQIVRRLDKEMKATGAQDYEKGDIVALPFEGPEGVFRSHGLHLIPDRWLTPCPVRTDQDRARPGPVLYRRSPDHT